MAKRPFTGKKASIAHTKGPLTITKADGSTQVVPAAVASGMAARTVVGKAIEFQAKE